MTPPTYRTTVTALKLDKGRIESDNQLNIVGLIRAYIGPIHVIKLTRMLNYYQIYQIFQQGRIDEPRHLARLIINLLIS